MKLTVAIPTYNRNQLLRENVQALLPQLTEDCQLLILDNGSAEPVTETLGDIFTGFQNIKYQIIRNRINIGGNTNILRCFEICSTEWIWVLSDAYQPYDNAINVILDNINRHSEATMINFCAPISSRKNDVRAIGLSEFVNFMDSFGSVLMISCNIFKCTHLLKHLQYAYHYSYTLAPHLVLVMFEMKRPGEVWFLKEKIVHPKSKDKAYSWSIILYPNILGIRDIPISKKPAKELLNKLRKETKKYLALYIKEICIYAMLNEKRNALWKYDLFRFRYFHGEFRVFERIALFGLRILVKYPKVLLFIYRLIKDREIEVDKVANPADF